MPKSLKPLHQDERYLLRWVDRNNQEPTPTLEFDKRDELDRWLDKEEERAEKAFASRDKTEKELGREELAAIRHGEQLTEKDDKLHKKVLSVISDDQLATANEEHAAFLENKKKREEERDKFVGLVKQTVTDKVQDAQEKVGKAIFQVSRWTTPGGIGLLVVLLLILAATVVPVNAAGDTRLKQFWYMLAGRATLTGRVPPTAGGVPYTDTLSISNVIGSSITSAINSPLIPPPVQAATLLATPGGIPLFLGEIGINLLHNQFRTNFGGLP